MKSFLSLLALLSVGHGRLCGPCRDVTSVDIDHQEWASAGGLYVNVQPAMEEGHCGWVYHFLTHDDSGRNYLSHYYKYIKNNEERAQTWAGFRVGPGHYVARQQLTAGRNSTVHTYFLYFDPPNLICYFTCTDDPLFREVRGGGPVCEGAAPDASSAIAPVIRSVAEENGFRLEDLSIVDNCKTNNKCGDYIPFEHLSDSKCKNVTVKEYFVIS